LGEQRNRRMIGSTGAVTDLSGPIPMEPAVGAVPHEDGRGVDTGNFILLPNNPDVLPGSSDTRKSSLRRARSQVKQQGVGVVPLPAPIHVLVDMLIHNRDATIYMRFCNNMGIAFSADRVREGSNAGLGACYELRTIIVFGGRRQRDLRRRYG